MRTRSRFSAAWLAFCVFLLHSLLLNNARATSKSHHFETFTDVNGGTFTNLAVDYFEGFVYVGGVNRLYQLNQTLELVTNYTTGPIDDSPECSIWDCPPKIVRTPTDNHNKALVIDYFNNNLIVCGSTRQGLCTIHSSVNVSKVLKVVEEPVVANKANASTIAFIAPGPRQSFVLYVGATFSGNSVYRHRVPAISSRSLDPNRMLSFAEDKWATGTKMFAQDKLRERYPINYVFGFSSGLFSYFLTTQMKSSSNSTYISKLVRVCHDDSDYYSYIEIPIECVGDGGPSYNLAQAAYVGRPGSELMTQQHLGMTARQDDVLFVIFSLSEMNHGERADKSSRYCALCIYPLSVIEQMFTKNIKECFSGKGYIGLNFIYYKSPCKKVEHANITEYFCGTNENSPLDGKIPVKAIAAQTSTTQLTSVAAISIGDYTVVFIGTKSGHLKKMVVENSTRAIEYSDLVIDEGSTVNSDMVFDAQMKNLYVMTERRVTKVKLDNCSGYESCTRCLTAKDPYCGWCSLENKCTSRRDCRDAAQGPSSWIPYNNVDHICK